MKTLILVALTLITIIASKDSNSQTCRLHIQGLEEGIRFSPRMEAGLVQAAEKKGYEFVSEAELRDGDYVIEGALEHEGYNRGSIPVNSVDLGSTGYNVLWGKQFKDIGCKSSNKPVVSVLGIDLTKKEVHTLDISIELRKKNALCTFVASEMTELEVREIFARLPKCGKL